MDINKSLQSKTFRNIIIAVGLLLIIILSFSVGVLVGFHKARFSYAWGDRHRREWGGYLGDMSGLFSGRGLVNGFGTSGTIVNIDEASSTMVVSGRDGNDKNISFSSSTIFMEDSSAINPSQLKINDNVLVIGSPNDQGQIEAKFIRILDEGLPLH